MGLLDVVDEEDNIIGKADYGEIHEKGLRHRSVQIFVFKSGDSTVDSSYDDVGKEELLVAERSMNQEISKLKLHPSAGGHVRQGQTYAEAAIAQLHDELFFQETFPNISIFPFGKFRNDTRETNKENSMLFVACYAGPFFQNPKEIQRTF